jgi:hypothetical protein
MQTGTGCHGAGDCPAASGKITDPGNGEDTPALKPQRAVMALCFFQRSTSSQESILSVNGSG